jgi:hypothetical protein
VIISRPSLVLHGVQARRTLHAQTPTLLLSKPLSCVATTKADNKGRAWAWLRDKKGFVLQQLRCAATKPARATPKSK